MKLPISLDKDQSAYLEAYFGRKPTSDDIKQLIGKALPDFPQSKGHGGYRIENTPAYKGGYAWGKQAAQEKWDIDMWPDGAAADSQDAFEEWLFDGRKIDNNEYQKRFKEWLSGTRDGYEAAGGIVHYPQESIPPLTSGQIRDILLMQEVEKKNAE
jgi:hypothetical protein